jgi:hypothetical protein
VTRRTLVQRIDDWMNPIVVKELRQAVQSKLVVAALMLFLFVQIFILGTVLLSTEAKSMSGEMSFRAGRDLFMVLQGIMLGTCMLVPAYVGGRLGAERSDTNVDLLFISTLKPRQIVFGKFLSGIVLVLLIFSACTPFMTFTYLLRGIDMPTILFLVAMDFVLALWGVAGVIFLAVIPAPRPVKGAIGLGAFFGLLGLFTMGMGFTEMAVRFGFMVDIASREFWAPMLMMLVGIVGICSLNFSWAIAILNPPAANKAWPMRLCMLVYVVVLGIASYVVSASINHYGPLGAWLLVAMIGGVLQLFISVNERDEIGPRITRTVPRNPLIRLVAWLFYSGSAGGAVFSCLLMMGSLAAGLLVFHLNDDLDHFYAAAFGMSHAFGATGSGWHGQAEMLEMIRVSFLMGMYAYCFCLTAIVLRTLVFRGQVRPHFTWLIVLLLVGLGSVGPYMLMYFFAPQGGFYREDLSLMVTNPFLSVTQHVDRANIFEYGIFDTEVTPFLMVWASLATAGALPWLLGQMKRFVPLSRNGRQVNVIG